MSGAAGEAEAAWEAEVAGAEAAGADDSGEDAQRFPMRIRMPWKLVLLLWGVRPSTAFVDLRGDRIQIRYGPWRTVTQLENVARYDLTGPYRWWGAIGPRRSVRNGDFSWGRAPTAESA